MTHGGRPLMGDTPLTNAQRQARYRQRHSDYREKANLYMQSWRKLNAKTRKESKET